MKYIILILTFLIVLFIANSLMDKYFAKERERRLIIWQQKHAPKFLWCRYCGYAEHESYFKDGCPRCGRKIGG